MTKPVIADNKPSKVQLEKGQEYFYCACGLSSNQPFCDGSHKVTDITPKKFVAEEDGIAFLCMCKQSANRPYCDGTHKQFNQDQVGSEDPGISTNAD